MNRLIVFFVLIFCFTDFFAQKSDKALYLKANFEYKMKDTKDDFYNGNNNYSKLWRSEFVVGYRLDFDKHAIKFGALAYGWSRLTNESSSDIHTSKEIINSKSLGIESIYTFKLNKYPTRALGLVIGVNVELSYQYVFSNRHLQSSFNFQDDIEKNENYNISVFGTGLGLVLLKKINDKIAIDLSVGNRFYLPTNSSPGSFSGNHYLTTFSVSYKLN